MTEILITKKELKARRKVIVQQIKDGTLPDDEKSILKNIQKRIDDNRGMELDYSSQAIIILGFDSAETIEDNKDKIKSALAGFLKELREIKGFKSSCIDTIKPGCEPLKGSYSYYLKSGNDRSKNASDARLKNAKKAERKKARKLFDDWKTAGKSSKSALAGNISEVCSVSIDTAWDWLEQFEEEDFSNEIRKM